jgi:DNA-directed RNA polymerase subunit RPC12/RpoP
LAGRSLAHPTNKVLILFVEVCVKTLVGQGRKYPWEKPERCPKCGGVRVWGHGYVEAYFDEAGSQSVYLKRYRCPECRVVMRLRPSGYWKRIQAAVAAVRQCLMDRLEKGRWPPGSNPARQRHWLRALKRQVRTHLGMSYAERIAEGFAELVRRGVCAVSRAV